MTTNAAPAVPTLEYMPISVKAVDAETRTVEGWASTKNPDLGGDVWLPTAWRKSLHRWKQRGSRPKFVGYHAHALETGHSPVLGSLQTVKVEEAGISFKAWFAETDLGNEHLYLYDKGVMDAFSAGYLTLAALYRGDTDDKGKDLFTKTLKKWGIKEEDWEKARRILIETEIFEISCVVVGQNLEALTKALQSEDPKAREYAGKALERAEKFAGLQPGFDLKAVPVDEMKGAVEVFDFAHPAFDRLDVSKLRAEALKGVGEVEELGPPQEDEIGEEPTAGDPLIEEKRAIPYKDLGYVENEGTPWNGPAQIRAAEPEALKAICAWYDAENADSKAAYKLPHHLAGNRKAVWKGVAAAMGALLGARGGAKIPAGERKAVHSHLAKHYKHWDKEAPGFKDYSDAEIQDLQKKGLTWSPILALEENGEETWVCEDIKDFRDQLRAVLLVAEDACKGVADLRAEIESKDAPGAGRTGSGSGDLGELAAMAEAAVRLLQDATEDKEGDGDPGADSGGDSGGADDASQTDSATDDAGPGNVNPYAILTDDLERQLEALGDVSADEETETAETED